MIRFFLFFLFCAFGTYAFSQKGSIEGRVFKVETNEPLGFATVQIEGTAIGVVCDQDGRFVFKDVEPGFMRLWVKSLGFRDTFSPEIQVQGNQITYVDIQVREEVIALKAIVVKPNRMLKRIESPVSSISVGIKDIEKSAGANRDISRVIQTLPGVGVTDPNRNDLIVRGGGPSENVFYLDDIEIPVINHFSTQGASGGVVGMINPDFVREVNFYSGAFPANRINALSSIMDIRQKDGSKDRIHLKFSVGASDAALTMDGPLNKNSSFIFSARQSYLGPLFKLIGLPFLPTYNDFQLKYKYQIDSKNVISVIGVGALDDMTLNRSLEDKGNEVQKYILGYLPVFKQWNYTVGVVYKHYGKGFYDTWALSRSMLRNNSFKYRDNDRSNPKLFDYNSDETENKLRFERIYSGLPVRLNFGGGLNFSHYHNRTQRSRFENGAVRPMDYDSRLNLFSYHAFVQLSDSFFDEKLKTSLGMNMTGNNFNKHMTNPFNQFSPRISFSYTFSDKWIVNANAGRYAMRPSYTTLGYKTPEGVFANKNEHLKYIVSDQTIMGLEYLPSDMIRFTAEGFYKWYDRYPISLTDGISVASKGTEFVQVGDEAVTSSGRGRAYGAEFLLKINGWKNLDFTATYTFFRSEFTNSTGIHVPSSWDTEHLLNLIASYRLGKSWNFAARWRYVGGMPYSPIDEELSGNKKAWNLTNQAYTDYTRFNTLRLPSTHQLDIRIDKEFYFRRFVLNLYVDVQNVYNFQAKKAPVYTNRDTDGNVMDDPKDPQNRQLLRILDIYSGSVLPTLGIIVRI